MIDSSVRASAPGAHMVLRAAALPNTPHSAGPRRPTSVCLASLTFSSMSTAVRLVCSRFSISAMSSRMSPCWVRVVVVMIKVLSVVQGKG